MHHRRLTLATTAAALGWLWLGACGGGDAATETPGSPAGIDDDLTDVGLGRAEGTAHFCVDLERGTVEVTPLTSRAAFSGTTIDFDRALVLDQPGDGGRRVLRVALINRSGETLGRSPASGMPDGLRVVFSSIVSRTGPSTDSRQHVTVATVAGDGTAGATNGPAAASRLNTPLGVAVNVDGDIFIADYGNHRVRQLSGGMLSNYAGDGSAGGTNGVGANARLNNPAGIAWRQVDGSLIVNEFSAHRIRRIDSTGRVSTVAGDGTTGDADGAGDVARFRNPLGVTCDAAGVIYLTEAGGHRVRRIMLTGADPRRPDHWTVATIAGNGTTGAADGAGASARFNTPAGICLGADGALYLADRANQRVRRCTIQGDVTTVAGTGIVGDTDGSGLVARFTDPYGIAAVPGGLLVTERDANRLRLVGLRADGAPAAMPASWTVSTAAGAAAGDMDGDGEDALFRRPRLACADRSGAVLLAESDNHKVRRVTVRHGAFSEGVGAPGVPTDKVVLAEYDGLVPHSNGPRPFVLYPGTLPAATTSEPLDWAFSVPGGTGVFEFTVTVEAPTGTPAAPPAALGEGSTDVWVRTVAGSPSGASGYLNGAAPSARFDQVFGLAWSEPHDLLLVADLGNNALRAVDLAGEVGTVAGVPDGGTALIDGLGHLAQMDEPSGCALSPDGNYLFFCDSDNDAVRVAWFVRPDQDPHEWEVATIAGTGLAGYANGLGSVAQFVSPWDLDIDDGWNIWLTERGGNRVRLLRYLGGPVISPSSWRAYLVAGSTTGAEGLVDGLGSTARFRQPRGIAVGPDGALFIADRNNDVIRRIGGPGDPSGGFVETFVGGTIGYLDDTGTTARFDSPSDLVCDAAGWLFVTDRDNHCIRRVSPTGVVRTVAGGTQGSADGRGDYAQFDEPTGVALTAAGDLYVSDGPSGASRIRLVQRLIEHPSG